MSLAPMSPAELYLRMLIERAPPSTLLEVRYRRAESSGDAPAWGNFNHFFIDIQVLWERMRRDASFIRSIGQRTDVYVGCAPRLRYSGSREDVAPAAVLWADCDGPAALAALASFTISPSVIVTSGSPAGNIGSSESQRENAHAYWPLTHPLDVDALEEANRRLAQALGADPRCADAARILRVPDTLNFKHDPPCPVTLRRYTTIRHRPQDLLAALPDLPAPSASPPLRVTRRDPDPARGEDPLQAIEPRYYVRILTSRERGRDGKIRCPFHEDETPSLHVYSTPEQGWTCFACTTTNGRRLGGDIYTLASLLWGIPNHGKTFYELRDRLDDLFGIHRG
jgi:hypothetical protein